MDENQFKTKLKESLGDINKKVDELETNAAVLEVINKVSRAIGEPNAESEKNVFEAQSKLKKVKTELKKSMPK